MNMTAMETVIPTMTRTATEIRSVRERKKAMGPFCTA